MAAFYIPQENMMGKGSLVEAVESIKDLGFKKVLVVTDEVLNKIGLVGKVTSLLNENGVDTVVFDGTKPNPTVTNVNDGSKLFKDEGCDSIMTLGGGSPHDCGKGIAILTSNGGKIEDYEGLNTTHKAITPLVAINTTAGTASEMTRFCIITDEVRHIKMAIVDKRTTPILSVNDPDLMMEKPASLTAHTGLDALTHCVEAYVSTAATPLTDAVALEGVRLIKKHLANAVKDGSNEEAREGMAYAQFMGGMAFNNASLGYVHALAHQLGGLLDLPHGVCNAILLPHVQRYNAEVASERLSAIAEALGVNTAGMTPEQGAEAALDAIVALSKEVGVTESLSDLGVKGEHIETLAKNSMNDVCGFTNPKQGTLKDLCGILEAAM